MPRTTAGRIALGVGLGLGVVAAVTVTAAAALSVVMARKVVVVPRRREEEIRVLGATASTITLSLHDDTIVPGRYGLFFDQGAGHVRIGDVVEVGVGSVTRDLLAVDYGDPAAAERARLSGWYFLDPRELGVEVDDLLLDTEVGPAPAWFVPAREPTGRWAIHVHGRGVTRGETIRDVPVFHAAGYNSLLVSYRNDGVAPDSGDRRFGLGSTEWRDVEAALDHAVAHGATEIVLMGWSMGGATVLQVATRSRHRHVIRGVVLDSPVVDWRVVLDVQASERSVPLPIRHGALQLIGTDWGRAFTGQQERIDLDSMDFVARAGDLDVPVLLLHSADDGYVPADASRALSILRPDIVTYEEFTVARHAKLWNYDEARWNRVIRDWLEQLSR